MVVGEVGEAGLALEPVGRLVTRATNDVENVAEMFSAGFVALIRDVLKMVGIAAALVSPLTVEPIGVALPPNDPLLINLVQNFLNLMEGTGTLETLKQKWFNDGSWIGELP